ncbi:MAG TPA: hypothetical protein VLN91_03650 [Nitrospirota bacterium]|nr:hypothetical protein [Nitrospirota bacterium]
MKKFVAVMRRPIFFVIINFFLVNTLFSLLPNDIGSIVYNIGRISIMFYAGWLVAGKKVGGKWQSALAGVVIYFVDHVVIKGGLFLLNYLFKPEGVGLAAFGGVIASFIMFIPLSMLIGMIGGLVARSRREKTPADSE